MNIKEYNLDDLILDPKNARKHPEKNIKQLMASLTVFGQQKLIKVDKNNKVIAGNGTCMAAKNLGWKTLKGEESNLTDAENTAYAIADNQIGLTSEWNLEQYAENLREIKDSEWLEDWNAIGFEADEIELLLNANFEGHEDPKDTPPDTDDIPEKVKPIKVSKEQREIFEQAVSILREKENDSTITEGRALELFCAEYLSGA